MTHFIVICHFCDATEHHFLPYDDDYLQVLTREHKCRMSMSLYGKDDDE